MSAFFEDTFIRMDFLCMVLVFGKYVIWNLFQTFEKQAI